MALLLKKLVTEGRTGGHLAVSCTRRVEEETAASGGHSCDVREKDGRRTRPLQPLRQSVQA